MIHATRLRVVWCVIQKCEVEPFLKFLQDRFRAKIDPSRYILSYSGGKDSHFLYWFIREYMHERRIEIVGVNTSFEIPEIRDRILRNSDTILHPAMNRWDIKEQYGIPCYTKQQDEYIYRYQKGSRSKNTMRFVNGENPVMNLNRKASKLLTADKLHKISNKCCLFNKELPMMRYEKRSGKKAIIGVRQSESKTRAAKYQTCLKNNGDFTPIYDFTDELIDAIYEAYKIEVPKCYSYVSRTGCAGCPYGRNVESELALLPELQRKSATRYFRESYDVKGIDYNNLQMIMEL